MTTKKITSERKIARGAENTIHLPYQPRALTTNEVSGSDCYSFYSYKNQRIIQLRSPLHFALSLCIEFKPFIEVYVERPRTIAITDKRNIELTFWSRTYEGEECLYLTIPTSETIPAYANNVKAADADLYEDAARRNGIKIKYVFERDLIRESVNISAYFRLLPYVNSVRRILCRSIIRDDINNYLKNVRSCSLIQLQKALDKFNPIHVQAVTSWMVHSGSLRFIESSTLSLDTVFERIE